MAMMSEAVASGLSELGLSELEARVLCEARQAGNEDVATMMMRVMPVSGHASELEDMQGALQDLVRADLIGMSMNRDAGGRLRPLSKEDSLDAIADLRSGLRFRVGRWVDTRHSRAPMGEPFPYIVSMVAR
jgi:hypothetical protein